MPVRNENDRGKGHGIKTGIEHASADIMAQFDADLQFFAADLPALVQPLLDGECDVCLGSRFLPASNRAAYQPSLYRDLGNRVSGNVHLPARSGPKSPTLPRGSKPGPARRSRRIAFRDDPYSYEAEIVVRAGLLGLRLKEIPVSYASRHEGASMHANNLAVAKAGAVIIFKCFACWIRTMATRRREAAGLGLAT